MRDGSTWRFRSSRQRSKSGEPSWAAITADTIETMNDLAVAYWKAGHADQAIPLYESTLVKVRATLGEDHSDTLTIMDNLAVAYAAAGLHDKAIALHETAIARFKAKLGDDHLTTLVAMNNLARAYQIGGRVSDSIELYETTLARLRAKLSDDHPTTLAAMNGLARSYRLAGRARPGDHALRSRPWRAAERSWAAITRRRCVTTLDLADAYVAAGRTDKAIPLARAFLAKDRANRGIASPPRFCDAIPRGDEAAGKRVAHSGASREQATSWLPRRSVRKD